MSTATNKGNQNVFFQYGDPLTGAEFDAKEKNVSPLGVYDGALLTRVDDTTVTVSAWTAVISDGTYSVTARAASDYDVTSVSSTNRNIVLRWTYNTQNNWYVDILPVSDVNIQANDLVLGRAVYVSTTITGFSYTLRNEPLDLSHFVKVVPTVSASMKVLVKSGWVSYGTSRIAVVTQLSSTITAPVSNPRIDLIYIDSNGAAQLSTGTEAASPTAPSYTGKIVVAEITLQTSSTTITSSMISDARQFLSAGMSLTTILAAVYPVGSIFCNNAVSTNPATLLGFGTWVAIGGKVLAGLDGTSDFLTVNQTGGSLTAPHTHPFSGTTSTPGTGPTNVDGSSSPVATQNHTHTFSGTTSSTSISTLQPYLVVYMWYRSA